MSNRKAIRQASLNARRRRTALLVGTSLLAAPIAALAQEATDDTVGEVVVTAQFREQRLQDTPIAITAMTGATMEARSQNALTDLGRTAPNVTLQPSTSAYGNTAAISIRGVGQFDRDFSLEPGVGVYIDDVYYPTLYGAQLDLLDLDRVEILRGPQGTLAGKNSIGGAVKLFSRRATGSGGSIEGTYGSYQRHDFRGVADFALVPDQLFLRIAGVYKKRQGYIDRIDYACRHPGSGAPTVISNANCEIGREGGQDFKGVRANLRWTPSEKLDASLYADIYSDTSDSPPSRLISVNPANANAALLTRFLDVGKYESYSTYQSQRGYGYDGSTELNGYGLSGQFTYKLSEKLSVTSISAYRAYKARYDADLDGTSFGLVTQRIRPDFKYFTQEVRLNGSLLNDKIEYTAGVYYYDSKGISGGRVEITAAAVVPPTQPGAAAAHHLQSDNINASSKSVFLHTVLHPMERLNVSLGVRYTDEHKDLTFHRRDPQTLAFQLLEGVNGKYDKGIYDYRVAIDYRWSDALLTYANFSTGSKGGGISPRPFRVEQVVPFGPESLKAYEVGFKSDFLDRRVRLNAAAFYNDYDNIQLTITSGVGIYAPPASQVVNAGKARVKGVEFELEVRPTAGLQLDGSVSYLDFDYIELSPNALASRIQLGYITPFTPEWKWSVGAQYEFELGSDRTLTPRFDASYQSETYSAAINAATALSPGYTLANARLTYVDRARNWEAALAVTNLFDNYYYTSKYDNLYALTGTQLANVGRPREWSLSIKYRY
jgi:iron complex outermembrane receptor protein